MLCIILRFGTKSILIDTPKEYLILLQINLYLLIHCPQLDLYHILALEGVGFYCIELPCSLLHASEDVLSFLSRRVIVARVHAAQLLGRFMLRVVEVATVGLGWTPEDTLLLGLWLLLLSYCSLPCKGH